MAAGRIRIRKYEAVAGCGSFEVRFPDGRPTSFFHFDDLPSRRLRPETLTREAGSGTGEGIGAGGARWGYLKKRPQHCGGCNRWDRFTGGGGPAMLLR